jgi:transcriptional regulator with XRE-family HTH domain
MQTTITHSQSREARRELSLSQADVASALGFNRAYLSEFENGNYSRLTKSQTKKLRDFYTAKAEEARANGDDIELDLSEPDEPAAVPEVRTFAADGLLFRAAENVSAEKIAKTRAAIRQNDELLKTLLVTRVVRDTALFGRGEPDADTQAVFSEAFALLAANYLLLRFVTEWPEVGLAADNISLADDTILTNMILAAQESFVLAGLIADEEEGAEMEGEA